MNKFGNWFTMVTREEWWQPLKPIW